MSTSEKTNKQTNQTKGDKASAMTLSCVCAQNTEQSAEGIRKMIPFKNAKLAHRKLKKTFPKETK